MIKIKLTRNRNFSRLNPGAISEVAFRQLMKLWRAAIRAFVDAAIIKVHIDTGMSRASLLPVAGAVRHRSEIVDLTHGGRSRRGVTDISGGYIPGGTKSAATGARFGRDAYSITFGSKTRVDLRFKFDIVIFQWAFHDDIWGALEAGRQAFLDFFEKQAKNFITARPFLEYFRTGRLPVVIGG